MDQHNETARDDARRTRLRAAGAAIRNKREASELTQVQLGERLAAYFGEVIPQTTLSRWEAGTVSIDIEHLRAIELSLGVPLGTLSTAAGYSEPTDTLDGELNFMTSYTNDAPSALEEIRAAHVLGIGVRAHNQWRANDDGTEDEEWVVRLYTEAPHVVR